ncbi:MAG: RNA degradosome polyphosphate kinase [Ignavibacteria bacterium GWB2_35_6b]|nr:MAG: RNA degradosome polyphosphate kinase [Ignavibacteria bacterium GWB2_35_6b]
MLSKENLNKYFEPKNFFNREMSWLDFNRRVLDEALNPELPLLDKIKFLSIFFSNLDEFYMIRISGLKEQIRANVIEPSIDGATPIEQVKKIEKEIQPMLNLIYKFWKEEIVLQLSENDIIISSIDELSNNEKDILKEYFNREIYPVLTPLAFDPGRPFPYISNLSLSFAILIKKQNGEKHFARVKVPNILPRLLRIENIVKPGTKPSNNGAFCAKYIWLEDLIRHNLHELFPGVEILTANSFRVTRNTDIEIQEDEADDLLEVIEENIKQRKFGSVTRLEVEKDMPDFMLDTLTENLQITINDIHIIDGPLGLSPIISLYELPLHHLKEKLFHPVNPLVFEEADNIFAAIRKRDILLHHPFESFTPVIDFIKQASKDPDVLAIKQTLYRVGSDSPIIKYLIEAAERKKQVAVLVELKARFDEENNIFWARELEKAGVHVVYGLVGLKTHSKMTLVVRKETDGVKRYVHIATGNYNASTAKLYTDLGLFTTNPDIAADVSEIFNFLTGYSDQKEFRKLFVSPINTREKFLGLIQREITNVNEGLKGHLIFKMNSLVDPTIIAALYKASQTGVRVDLIIRGICCLIPQVPGLSENIFVRSIIGRFLEHSRIYYFYNNGSEDIYLSSADLMQRNLDRRVEATFPIEDPECKKTIIEKILLNSLKDNVKARILLPNGRFVHNHQVYTQERISVQEWLMENVSAATLKIVPIEKK